METRSTKTLRSRVLALLALGLLCLPALAHAQGKRLETFTNYAGTVWHRWSDDGGINWAGWTQLPTYSAGLVGAVGVVSDQSGRLWVAAKATDGSIVFTGNSSSDPNWWWPWTQLPGSFRGPGGVVISTGWSSNDIYFFNADSYPAISSWGPGRVELFMNGTRQGDGSIALLHTWADNGQWSGRWEVLGTGLMHGSPAAVSWGPGRTDVFVRGGGYELEHKWFANGSWSSGWENLGGYLTTDMGVVASGSGRLNIFARATDGSLAVTWFNNGWGGWGSLGGLVGEGTSVTGASRQDDVVDVFVFGSDRSTVFDRSFDYWNGGWGDFRVAVGLAVTNVTAVTWVPTKRLDVFDNFFGLIYHHWSGDGGHTWSSWELVPPIGGYFATEIRFAGAPAVVSDRPGHLMLTTKTTNGTLVSNVYDANSGTWGGWYPIPGNDGIYGGGVWIAQGWCCKVINYPWNQDSDTALASWGPGRFELFINGTRLTDGALVLLHTWADNGQWSGKWEVLGSGLLVGSPTAISWGLGRTDVFVQGGAHGLAHKWFDRGAWSTGWEDLGPYITSSPSVASATSGHLDVYARGGDGALWHRWYAGGWSGWDYQGGFIEDGTSPTATSAGRGNLDVFVLGGDQYLYEKSFRNNWWFDFANLHEFLSTPRAIYWVR